MSETRPAFVRPKTTRKRPKRDPCQPSGDRPAREPRTLSGISLRDFESLASHNARARGGSSDRSDQRNGPIRPKDPRRSHRESRRPIIGAALSELSLGHYEGLCSYSARRAPLSCISPAPTPLTRDPSGNPAGPTALGFQGAQSRAP